MMPIKIAGARMRALAGALALAGSLLLPGSAPAAEVPNAVEQELLIKTSLLTLNDANVTGNYAVLHAKMAKPAREQFSPDKLKRVFKEFADKKIDFDVIAAKSPIVVKDAQIDARGEIQLRGYFDVSP